MSYVFSPPETQAVPVVGSDKQFPVRRILCVGRNYGDHVREMGGDPNRNPPFFFAKPADALVQDGATVPYPPLTDNFHYEIELVVAIGKTGSHVPVEKANELIYGYAVGVDLTRRDQQQAAMKAGHPWEFGKSFDASAPCGPIYPVEQTGIIEDAHIWLKVNGETHQDGTTAALIWSVPEVISLLSGSIVLQPGDLIYTGTPAGVGPVVPGDVITGGVAGLGEISITIAPKA
jgi:fumarylpyruvate hydrolase